VYVAVILDSQSPEPLLLTFVPEQAVFELLEEVQPQTQWKSKHVYSGPVRVFNGRVHAILEHTTPVLCP
jgi:hypothetical protein